MQTTGLESAPQEMTKARPMSIWESFALGLAQAAGSKKYCPKDTRPGNRPRTLKEKMAKRNAYKEARRIRKIRAGRAH